jgi:hypothetical protein
MRNDEVADWLRGDGSLEDVHPEDLRRFRARPGPNDPKTGEERRPCVPEARIPVKEGDRVMALVVSEYADVPSSWIPAVVAMSYSSNTLLFVRWSQGGITSFNVRNTRVRAPSPLEAQAWPDELTTAYLNDHGARLPESPDWDLPIDGGTP